ncbi:hypothetical protein K439DRAFT_539396 [Ramaria rubella]|nr:hypothetical protein K439DRAFT_539396 [Ramaria rubella]
MPKREPTPPPGDDEPRYLTICYPYPPHANMELPGDRLALARWLACCMGQDDMYAIFHKPSAGNMVIVEIRRDHEGFRKLLGAHKWSEFVRNPGEHHSKVTRIFFSTFPNGRAVEKAGWKRLFVEDSWFNKFSPKNKFIAYPYPLSSYCEVPSEDQTGFTLCRPIPLEMFDIRIPSPPLVPVGSATWVAYKGGPGSVNRKSYALASSASSQVSGKSIIIKRR